MKNILQDIIKRAIDIHVHIGPEIIPRKYSVGSLIDSERGKIAGMVLKNHFYPTKPFIREAKNLYGMRLFGGVVLNNAVGGLNAEAIYASSLLSDGPLMVWFPTINAEQFLDNSEYEIAPEWVQRKGFTARKTGSVSPVRLMIGNKLLPEVEEVLEMIKKTNAVLATGHISWRETLALINRALEIGIESIVVTHPIYQRISMPIKVQKDLAKLGCFIEQSYSMYSIDDIPIKQIADQIKAAGAKSIILSSDVGQAFSPAPSEALCRFAKLLAREGISEAELKTMLVDNPRKLLGIK